MSTRYSTWVITPVQTAAVTSGSTKIIVTHFLHKNRWKLIDNLVLFRYIFCIKTKEYNYDKDDKG